MTCHDLGGPCEYELRGETADDVIKAQDRHLKDAVEGGDPNHATARRAMQGRWKHPKKSMDWYNASKSAFAALPED